MALKRCFVCNEYGNLEAMTRKGDAYRHADCDTYIPRTTLEFTMEFAMERWFKANPNFASEANMSKLPNALARRLK